MEKDDFIRRKAAILMVQRYGVGCLDPDEFTPEQAERFVIARLQAMPAADVRPVVLCRDCQNSYEWANVDGDNYRYCGYLRSRWNHDADRMVDDDDFCKWGRKREEQT